MDHRYKKRIERYWMRMLKQGKHTLKSLDVHGWFDHWHVHPDWFGKGNRYPENRLRAAEIGYELLICAEKSTKFRRDPIQCWLTVCENTSDNAVYLHSENPNGSAFPYDFAGTGWGMTEIPGLGLKVDTKAYDIGMFRYQEIKIYIIKSKA